MVLLDEFDGNRYGLLEHEDVAEMARVIGHVFSRSDPLGVAIGMAADDIEAFVLVFGAKAVAEGLTVIARGRSGAGVSGFLCVRRLGDLSTAARGRRLRRTRTRAAVGKSVVHVTRRSW